jgi:RNA polymerase sigma factor (sigma-70 family)
VTSAMYSVLDESGLIFRSHARAAHLEPTDEKMLRMFFFGKYTIGEISETIGIARQTVSRRIKRALGKIRPVLVSEMA